MYECGVQVCDAVLQSRVKLLTDFAAPPWSAMRDQQLNRLPAGAH